MARWLPFLALTSPTLRGCPWRTLLWSYAGATRASKQGTPLKGKDALLRASVPFLTRVPSTEGYQCRHRQVYHPQRGISAILSKDASTERHQCYLEQGCFYRGISATTSKDALAKASVLSINYLRAGVFWPGTPVCTVPKSRAAVDYTLTGVEPHGPTRSVWPIVAPANRSQSYHS